MKKNYTNRRVINSIGIGILAMITAGTPVLAGLGDEPMSEETEVSAAVDAEAGGTQGAGDPGLQVTGGGVTPGSIDDQMYEPEADFVPPSVGAAMYTVNPLSMNGGVAVEDPEPEGAGDVAPLGEEPKSDQDDLELSEDTEDPETTEEDAPPVTVESEISSEEISQMIEEVKEDGKEATDNINAYTGALKEQNAYINSAKKDYDDAVAPNVIGSIAGAVEKASEAVVDAVYFVTKDATTARDQAQIAVDAQVKQYGSKEEAETAQQQAQAAAAAAEEAYKSAQATVENAESNKKAADERLSDLERQKAAAALALEDVKARIQDAEERIREILISNGCTEEEVNAGKYDPDRLDEAAKEAYKKAQEVWDLANRDLDKAEIEYDKLAVEVEAATKEFEGAQGNLNSTVTAFEQAKSEFEGKVKEWETAKYQEQITQYNESVKGTEEVLFDLQEAENALEQAKIAYDQAKEIKDKAEYVVGNAQAAADVATSEAAQKTLTAKNAAEAAEAAITEKAEDVQSAIDAAAEAAKVASEAEEKAKLAIACLTSVQTSADEAKKELEDAKKDLEDAEKDLEDAQKANDEAQAELSKIQDELLETQAEIIKNIQKSCQEYIDNEKSVPVTIKLELAKELLKYRLIDEKKVESGIEIVRNEDGSPYEYKIIVSYSNDSPNDEFYFWEPKNDAFSVYRKGQATTPYINEDLFSERLNKYNTDCASAQEKKEEAQRAVDSAQIAVTEAEERVLTANAKVQKAEDQQAMLAILGDVKQALHDVQQQAKQLMEKEIEYKNQSSTTDNNLISTLRLLVDGGNNLDLAESKLDEVNRTKADVETAIEALKSLSMEGEIDESAYAKLLDAYNVAVRDHANAVDALKKCVEGLNSAKSEKDRARIAANAIFSYVSGGNTGTTTPTQPGNTGTTTPTQPSDTGTTTPESIYPIYGTLIDDVVFPTTSGISTPAGNGYIYTTIWDRATYTVPTGEPEAEAETEPEELVSVADEEVPLAEVGEKTSNKTTANSTRKVSDEKVPLADIEPEKDKISWWWILVIALLGATGTEMYIRHQKKTEQENKAKNGKNTLVKI